jgi:hypothetical protein
MFAFPARKCLPQAFLMGQWGDISCRFLPQNLYMPEKNVNFTVLMGKCHIFPKPITHEHYGTASARQYFP